VPADHQARGEVGPVEAARLGQDDPWSPPRLTFAARRPGGALEELQGEEEGKDYGVQLKDNKVCVCVSVCLCACV